MIFEKNHKCEICIESKFTKPSFQTSKRSSEPLELIHSDIGDLKVYVNKRWKKVLYYFYRLLHKVLLYLFAY
jgi:hypothetical protein